jgi:hypothetical protein
LEERKKLIAEKREKLNGAKSMSIFVGNHRPMDLESLRPVTSGGAPSSIGDKADLLTKTKLEKKFI